LDLLKSAAGASDDYTLHHVLIELGRLGGPEAGEALIQILKSDCKGWVKQRAAGGLGNTGGPGALEALLEAYRTDSFYLQVASAGAMHRLGYSGPLTEMLPKIGTMLDNPDGSVRRDATEQLRQLTSPQAIPLLTRALQDSNGDVRIEAIRMLSTGKVPGSLALLEKMLADPNPDVVESAKSAMLTLRQASDNKER
jgi:HEAT repeat protein